MSKKKGRKIKFIKNAKIKKNIINILKVFLICCVLYNIIFFLNTTIKKIEYFNLFGISIFCMENDLMEPDIIKNSLIITKSYSKNTNIEVNDIIAYSINGKVRINKIVNIKSDNGKIIYSTKSNKNYYTNSERISKNQVIGKVKINIPFLGWILKILQSKILTVIILIVVVTKFIYNKKIYKNKLKRKVQLYNRKNKKETFGDKS